VVLHIRGKRQSTLMRTRCGCLLFTIKLQCARSRPALADHSADTSDRRAGALLLSGLSALFPRIRTVIADARHESRELARTLKQRQGWQLRIVKRRQRVFKITGLTWIVECSFAWLGRNRRLSKDYEYRVQTSETMIDLAAIRLMLSRIAPV
jgi:transposase